jgi:hypothetical protein
VEVAQQQQIEAELEHPIEERVVERVVEETEISRNGHTQSVRKS